MHAWAIMRAGGKRRGKPAECMQSVRECSCSLLALAQEEEEEERNRMKRRDGFRERESPPVRCLHVSCLSVAQASSLSPSPSLSHARSTMQIDAESRPTIPVVKTTTTTMQQCRTKYHRGIAYIHIERDSEIKRTGCASGARRQRMQLQAEAKARDLCDERVNVDENVQNP